jgi:hypothetical protein
MWIKPDYKGTLEELTEEVENALRQFEKDKFEGKLKPISDDDKEYWC